MTAGSTCTTLQATPRLIVHGRPCLAQDRVLLFGTVSLRVISAVLACLVGIACATHVEPAPRAPDGAPDEGRWRTRDDLRLAARLPARRDGQLQRIGDASSDGHLPLSLPPVTLPRRPALPRPPSKTEASRSPTRGLRGDTVASSGRTSRGPPARA